MKIPLNSIRIPERRQRQTVNSERLATEGLQFECYGCGKICESEEELDIHVRRES